MQAESATTSSTRREVTVITNPVVSIVLSVLLTIALKSLIERTWLYPTALWNGWWPRTIGTIVVAGIGAGLFWLRKRYQTLYGISEVSLGVAGIWAIFGKLQTAPDPPSWVALVAAAYLIVRGLTNCEEGTTRS
jgi:hypothetical protein